MFHFTLFSKITVVLTVFYVLFAILVSCDDGFDIETFIYWLFPLITVLSLLWILGKEKIVNYLKAIKSSFSNILIPNYFQLAGCITRKVFIIHSLILLLLSSCIMGVLILYKCLLGIYILSVVCIFIFSILAIKRIHDTGNSAYQYLVLSIIAPLATLFAIKDEEISVIANIGTLCGFYLFIYTFCIAFIGSKNSKNRVKYKYEKILFIFGICIYIIMAILSYQNTQTQIKRYNYTSTETRYVPHNNYNQLQDIDSWEKLSPEDEYFLLGTGSVKPYTD